MGVIARMAEFARYLIGNASTGVVELLGTLAVFVGFYCVGRLCGVARVPAAALVGWAAVSLVAVGAAIVGVSSLTVTIGVFVSLGVLGALVRRSAMRDLATSWPWMVSIVPLAGLGTVLPSFYWDGYSHWLPNALYLIEMDHFPVAPLDGVSSDHPTYPPALALVIYLVTAFTRRYSESAGLLTNVLVSAIAVGYLTDSLRPMLFSAPTAVEPSRRSMLVTSSLVAILVFVINPSFQLVHYWSAIADPPLAIVVLVTLGVWCEQLAVDRPVAVAGESRPRIDRDERTDWAVLFFLGALIGLIKHSGWQITLVLLGAGAVVCVCRGVPLRRAAKSALAIGLGTGVACAMWKYYLATELPIQERAGEVLLPLAEWRYDLLGPLLRAALTDARQYWIYYGTLCAFLIIGIRTLSKSSSGEKSPLNLMLGIASVSLLAHLACLACCLYRHRLRGKPNSSRCVAPALHDPFRFRSL